MADGGPVDEGSDGDPEDDENDEDDGPSEIADHVKRVRDLLGDGKAEESATED